MSKKMNNTDSRLLLLSESDNVLVVCQHILPEETLNVSGIPVKMKAEIQLGHKLARQAIAENEKVLKYGASIGTATCEIAIGEHVHLHNMKSDYTKTHIIDMSNKDKAT